MHIGLDVDSDPGVFKLERSALRDGYQDIPDIDRRVFTRLENKKEFGKAPDSLVTTLEVDMAAWIWRDACSTFHLPGLLSHTRGKSKVEGSKPVDVRLSDDVGTYVCGFQYYVSMLEAKQKSGNRNVVFLHVPQLDSEEEVRIGVMVVQELIKALVNVLQ